MEFKIPILKKLSAFFPYLYLPYLKLKLYAQKMKIKWDKYLTSVFFIFTTSAAGKHNQSSSAKLYKM